MQRSVAAVIWDFDNTLVDSRAKNLAVTRRIAAELLGSWDRYPMLGSLDAYERALWRTRGWRDLYRTELGMDDALMDEAASLWTGYQIADSTDAPLLPGVQEALAALSQLPHAIVSANSRRNIDETLERHGLKERFRAVIGYEEVHLRAQKPAPDGLLLCMERLGIDGQGVLLYVGDHEVDARCAANANAVLERRGAAARVLSVGADYGRSEGHDWGFEPDYRADSPERIVRLVESFAAEQAGPVTRM